MFGQVRESKLGWDFSQIKVDFKKGKSWKNCMPNLISSKFYLQTYTLMDSVTNYSNMFWKGDTNKNLIPFHEIKSKKSNIEESLDRFPEKLQFSQFVLSY